MSSPPKSYAYATKIGAEVGFKIWLIFFLGFAILGLPGDQCLVFSALAGWVLNRITAYWKAEESSASVAQSATASQPESVFRPGSVPIIGPFVVFVERVLGVFTPKIRERMGEVSQSQPRMRKKIGVYRSQSKRRIGR